MEPNFDPEGFFKGLTNDVISDNIRAVFDGTLTIDDPSHRAMMAKAFMNLTYVFTARQYPALLRMVQFDLLAFQMLISRFHRDAYGVGRFHETMDDMVESGDLTQKAAEQIGKLLYNQVGIRINTEDPKKTKIAAAFTLWMCTFRPVHFGLMTKCEIEPEDLELFGGTLAFALAGMFLSLHGEVVIKDDEPSRERYRRVRYDFTYRSVNLSSLELLYASVFTPKTPPSISLDTLPPQAEG